MKYAIGMGVVAALAFAAAAICSTPASAATTCDVASMQAASPPDTTIVSAQHLDAPVPHCKVDGYVTTTNPGPNRNNFRLQLPDKALWKDRYYFVGEGGSAGYVPTDSQIPGGNPMMMGMAVAGTDTGHQAPGLDWSFLSDPAKTIDHVHRGAHVVAVATQQLTRDYYGVDKIYRYHSGCSGGGRMGMEAIQMHPEDYDGVLLGWPGGRLPEGHTGMFVSMVREMTREPGSWLSPAKLKFADSKVMEACDALDGAVDDMIWDHRVCHYDFNKLKCQDGDKPDCLTQPEITSIEDLLRDTEMPISNMSMWSMFLGSTPPPWSADPAGDMTKTAAALIIETTWARTYLNEPNRDIVKDPLTAADLAAMNAYIQKIEFNTHNSPDLSRYANDGGKAIFFVGVSDPCCSNIGVENYISDVKATMGADRVGQFVRLYEIPGAGHCGGGTGPNDHADQLFKTLVAWVEDGKSPEGVVMHRGLDRAQFVFPRPDGSPPTGPVPAPSGLPSRDFLVCPQPQVSVFDKSKANVPGAVYDAANWSCQRSRT